MSAAQLVVQFLPYLRRYARALTGSQAAGDAYVAATLETLVSDPGMIGGGANVKVALFTIYTRIWNSLAVNGENENVARDLPAEIAWVRLRLCRDKPFSYRAWKVSQRRRPRRSLIRMSTVYASSSTRPDANSRQTSRRRS
jgi:hypothetical protein